MLCTVAMDMDSDGVLVGRLAVVDTGRRRDWTEAEKVRIVEESFQGHRQASATAKRHGISRTLLFRWRRAHREGTLGAGAASGFARAVVVPDQAPARSPGPRPDPGRVEIVLTNGRRLIVDATVEATALARLVDVLEAQ